MEPVAGSMLPTAFHPAGHAHSEVHPYVVVQGPVVLGSVRTEGTISVIGLPRNGFSPDRDMAVPFHFLNGCHAYNVK